MITNRLPWPLNDGGNIASYHMIEQLIKHGHEVSLLSLNTLKHHQDPLALMDKFPVETVDIDTSLTFFGLLKGLFQRFPYNVQRFQSVAFRKKIRELLRVGKFDAVQFEGIYLSIYMDVLKEFRGVKRILRPHNVEHRIWSRLASAEKNPIKRIYLQTLTPKIERFEREHLHDFDGIAAITPEDALWFRDNGFSGNLKTVPAGVDLQKFYFNTNRTNALSVRFLGSLEWMPNRQGLLWFLESVWPELRRRFPELIFHVAGKNPPLGFLASPPDGVVMHGEVADAADFMGEGGIMVVPLMAGGGMRLKIVEAMACGLCVVSTVVGAEGIAAQDGQSIVVAQGADEWLERLTALCQDEQLRISIGRQGRTLAERNFGWDATGDSMNLFYAEVMG